VKLKLCALEGKYQAEGELLWGGPSKGKRVFPQSREEGLPIDRRYLNIRFFHRGPEEKCIRALQKIKNLGRLKKKIGEGVTEGRGASFAWPTSKTIVPVIEEEGKEVSKKIR